ncbi:MAG: metallophosphatase family protein [Actinomycetota bacterium]|nr:metallophosphatase family protein [Actinomycetota bacterium]
MTGSGLGADGDGPRRIALLSDVHGNLPAFEAVLADVRRTGVDQSWCLGDLVGYGAQPDECIALAAEACDVCLVGNHDLVVLGKLNIAEFSSHAAVAAEWTRRHIGEEAAAFIGRLPTHDTSLPLGLYHASPRDPVWEYVLSTAQADACLDAMRCRVGAIGHSHVALWFHRADGEDAVGSPAPGGTQVDVSSGRWLLNPGGVGQPRDGDPRAAWMLLDLERWRADWRRVEYPIDDAATAIERAGLPRMLSERLYLGQ